jgi:hypothetical protein
MAFGNRNRRVPRPVRNAIGLHPSPRAFRRWLDGTRPDGPGGGGPADQRWLRYGTYSLPAFVCEAEGNELVDHVLPLERIDELLPPLLASIGIPGAAELRVPRKNVSARSSSSDGYYDRATVDLVARRYGETIDRFGYAPPIIPGD